MTAASAACKWEMCVYIHELILAVTCVRGVKRDESGPWSPSKWHQNDITILMTRVSFAQVPDERDAGARTVSRKAGIHLMSSCNFLA